MIRFAIVGNGNLGRACREQILKRPNEAELVGLFSRRESAGTLPLEDIGKYKGKIDVVLFCGGSSNDAPVMVPKLLAQGFSTVDSYDNHGEIGNGNYPELLAKAAKTSGATAIIGAGWEPGIMSIQRILNKAYMPNGVHNALYGSGLSMGHTSAIKSIAGVVAAHQITTPREDAKQLALGGKEVPSNDRHRRICYVVAEPGMEQSIEKQIRNMQEYFKDQQVEVHFINMDTFTKKFTNQFGHGGQIISADDNTKITWVMQTKNNPIMTANAMLAYARANFTMQNKGLQGAFTVDEVPPAYLLDDATRKSLI